ncbi:hypothetical protein T05_15552 [Trichinella murrelli]|uniref:Uncharacterized protein n=1 Tax=Trichinella murrelli TaxID=144512 RepID=A0A0V0UIP3_9BILA|nr:hypothetical protein T05_15552 [Trichinella murrelli]
MTCLLFANVKATMTAEIEQDVQVEKQSQSEYTSKTFDSNVQYFGTDCRTQIQMANERLAQTSYYQIITQLPAVMRYLIFTSKDSTRKRVLGLLLLLWLPALWNSLVWSSGVCVVRPMSIWPANLATLQWVLGAVSLSDVTSRDGPQNVANLIEDQCLLNDASPEKLYPVNTTWEISVDEYNFIFRNHSSVEEYSELGRRACMIQNAAFYPVLQRTIVETASLGMLDISKTEVTFRERRRGNLEINNIENGRLTMDYY